jgi:chorismate mutase
LIAIENVRLFDDVQKRTQELSESLEQQTATSEVLQVISSSPGELEPVFNANAVRICGTHRPPIGTVWYGCPARGTACIRRSAAARTSIASKPRNGERWRR